MSEIRSTEAARHFGALLDAVERRGETFTIIRRGKPIASLRPTSAGHGKEVKELLRRHRPDPQWSEDLAAVRSIVDPDRRGAVVGE